MKFIQTRRKTPSLQGGNISWLKWAMLYACVLLAQAAVLFIRLGIRGILATSTVPQDEIGSGLNQMRYVIRPYYRVWPGVTVFSEFEHEDDYGTFKNFQRIAGESKSQNTLTFEFMFLL